MILDSVIQILFKRIGNTPGTNDKIDILSKHKNNELIKRILEMTYDKVKYTYGISEDQIDIQYISNNVLSSPGYTLTQALDALENELCTRNTTGKAARELINTLYESLSHEERGIFYHVIERDQKIGMGRTNINKVFPGLIIKPLYMRCDVYTEDSIKEDGKLKKGTARNINYSDGAILQLKADGTYREFTVYDASENRKWQAHSRSGEAYRYYFPIRDFPAGRYHGEITVKCDAKLLERILPDLVKLDKKNGTNLAEEMQERYNKEGDFILPRSLGNGLLNSDDVPHYNLILELWDYITPEEYAIASKKDKKLPTKTKYIDRFKRLTKIINGVDNLGVVNSEPIYSDIRVIETHEVFSKSEALQIVRKWMQDGFEGGVIKDKSMLYKDGTSKQQLKLKLEVECDVRITGFTPGKGKNEKHFGAVTFSTDDNEIIGKVGVSTMKESLRDWFTLNMDALIGEIMEVQFNDLSKARNHTYYALSHPRFIELRSDKDYTDTLQKVFDNRDMAMGLKKLTENSEESE